MHSGTGPPVLFCVEMQHCVSGGQPTAKVSLATQQVKSVAMQIFAHRLRSVGQQVTFSSMQVPLHSFCPMGQAQAPNPLQAFPPRHTFPQAPQLLSSTAVLTQLV